MAMNSVTLTEPSVATRPTSFRPRSTSMTCSARSLGSASSVSAIVWSWDSVTPRGLVPAIGRSEEHTSELQSRLHLVCRLLLEKKKKSNQPYQELATLLHC